MTLTVITLGAFTNLQMTVRDWCAVWTDSTPALQHLLKVTAYSCTHMSDLREMTLILINQLKKEMTKTTTIRTSEVFKTDYLRGTTDG